MKIKRKYESPELILFSITPEDIITTSGNHNDIDEDMGENDGEWL